MNSCPHCGEPSPSDVRGAYYCNAAVLENQRVLREHQTRLRGRDRNRPCPCGSNKKAKQCCGANPGKP